MNAKRQEPGVAKNHYSKAKLEGKPIPESPQKGKPGCWLGRKHSEKTKALLKQKALASKHRRLRRGLIEYKGITLESSWELLLAIRLDELGIEWTRPDPIPWIDENGITHNYFPDFYLPKQNLYLDPKNPVALRVQEKKLQCLLKQYDNIIIIKTPEECETFILP